MSDKKCEIIPTKKGFKTIGNCAKDLLILAPLQNLSKKLNREISAGMCLNPKTGRMHNFEIFNVGTPTQTSLPSSRKCSSGEIPVTMHTHPVSGKSEFSKTDRDTIVGRFNKKTDGMHCVAGNEKAQCILTTEINYN